MRIFIHRGNRTLGPYSLEDISRELSNGSLKPTDMATYDGEDGKFVPLSAVPGIGALTPSGAQGQPSYRAPKQKRRVGCCGWFVLGGLALVVIGVIGGMIVGDSGRWENSRMASGILTIKVTPVDRPHTIGNDIAKKVYDVAHDHPELQRLIINVDLYPTLMSDKYGHEAKGPMHMGTITVDDLAEVRRYTFDGAYMSENKAAFAAQIARMDYAQYLTM